MTLNTSHTIYIAAALTVITALGTYIYVTKKENVVPSVVTESDDEEKSDS